MPVARTFTIHEISELTGVAAATLRKWEDRYGLVVPERLPNGYRGYSERDVALLRWVGSRVRSGALVSMVVEEAKERLATGWDPLSERAAPAVEPAPLPPKQEEPLVRRRYCDRLLAHLLAIDGPGATRLLDEIFGVYQVETVLLDVFADVLHEVGNRWTTGAISEYQEHFASGVIRDRLSALRAMQASGTDPHLITACVPGERHEIGPLTFSILAMRAGCRVTHLSASPSPSGLCRAVTELRPNAICLGVTIPTSLNAAVPHLKLLSDAALALSPRPLLVIGGQGLESAAAFPELREYQLCPGRGDRVLQQLLSRLPVAKQ